MELLLIKLVIFFISLVASFMFAVSMPFIFFYAFFGIPYLFLLRGFWKGVCLWGVNKTWAVNKWFICLPATIVKATVGGGGNNHGNNRRRH